MHEFVTGTNDYVQVLSHISLGIGVQQNTMIFLFSVNRNPEEGRFFFCNNVLRRVW